MAINFPATPSTNQTYTFNGRTWTWNGVGWQATGSTGLTVYTKTDFTATAGQTSFSATYTVGFVDVYYNGSKLSTSEYTATTGSTVVLGTACAVGDIVETIAWTISSSFNPSLGSASATSLAIGGATIGSNALAVTGTTNLAGLLTATTGISSTLVTDATSATTGSIITAGGISCQKSLWVGTTSALIGNVGIGMTPTNVLDITQNQNAASIISISNNSAGAASQTYLRLNNGTYNGYIQFLGTAFTTAGVQAANDLVVSSAGGVDLVAGNVIKFAVNGSTAEVARFGTDGSFLIGTKTNGGWTTNCASEIRATGNALSTYTTSGGFAQYCRKDSTSGGWIAFSHGGTTLGSIYSGGGTEWRIDVTNSCLIQAGGGGGVSLSSGATAWAAVSDETLKTDLLPIQSGVEKVSSLRAVTGRYKADEEGVSRSFLIAQDVQKVLPEAVSTDADGTLSLRYTEVIPLMVAAIQELTARLTALETK